MPLIIALRFSSPSSPCRGTLPRWEVEGGGGGGGGRRRKEEEEEEEEEKEERKI